MYPNNKGAEQMHRLVSAFVVRCIASKIPKLDQFKASIILLVSVAEQINFYVPWSQKKTRFIFSWYGPCYYKFSMSNVL